MHYFIIFEFVLNTLSTSISKMNIKPFGN